MDIITGYLEVGANINGEVVITHRDVELDEDGTGHIVFSPNQARNLAALLLKHADIADAGRFQEAVMYQPGENDLSGRNFQAEMKEMLYMLLPAYEGQFGLPGRAPALVKEFNDMCEFSGATVVGVADRAAAVLAYVKHHYTGSPKPDWYVNLTGR